MAPVFSILLAFIAWAAPFVIIALLVVWLVNRSGGASVGPSTPPALAILDERYASGEIDRGDYLQRRADLGG